MSQQSPSNSSTDLKPRRIGWIGTGVMGASMCRHLIDAGHDVRVFSRTRSKAQPLLDLGAQWAASPAAAATDRDVVFSIVGFPKDVRQVLLGGSESDLPPAFPAAAAGTVFVDMTTSSPSLAIELARSAAAKRCSAIDAPVSGGDVGAKSAALSIMIGGDSRSVDQVMPLLQCLGKTIVHQGDPGSGQHTKMVNQTLIATNMIGVCEALLYAHRAGLDVPTVLKSVSSGAAGSWSLSNLAPRMLDRDYEPGFYVQHFVKDMGIALEEARRMQLSLPGLALAFQLYQSVMASGNEKKGTQALLLALAKMSSAESEFDPSANPAP
ncbi:MAG: NAD(P)-dependent oxidoreductase [Planctomycetota bacterium]